jgi:hypothetical protein
MWELFGDGAASNQIEKISPLDLFEERREEKKQKKAE